LRPQLQPRRGFGRLIGILTVVLFATLALRMGAFGSLISAARDHGRSAPLAQGLSPPGVPLGGGSTAPAVGSGDGAKATGPPPFAANSANTANAAATDLALTRFAAIGRAVHCGGGTKPLVAVTFDDGPGPYTGQTLKILRAAGASATFFSVGRNIAGWPSVPSLELGQGAIGDHTWTHIPLKGESSAVLQEEIGRTQDALAAATGSRIGLFRPPFGSHDAGVDHFASALGMVEVLWSVDSEDSAGAPPEEVLANAVSGARPGAIILLHENRGSTLSVLPQILQAIRQRGLQTVTVPELLALDPPTVDQLEQGTCPVPTA
jgi:peptidoglycan/xylan/chitin deacetylase (PgdA/CDA1 family)